MRATRDILTRDSDSLSRFDLVEDVWFWGSNPILISPRPILKIAVSAELSPCSS